jgi:hypothetical protein
VATLFGYMAASFFLFAAVTGAAILRGFLGKRKVALGGALIHGLFAISGIILLALSLVWSGGLRPWTDWTGHIALVILIGVAMGGGVMVYFHVWHRKLPMWLAGVHALGAVVATIMVWYGVVRWFFIRG